MSNYPADQIFAPADLVREIADAGHTPFYLYHAEGIRRSIESLHGLFSWNPGYQNYFPLRDNLNPHLLRILLGSNTGVCVTGKDELAYACRCGFFGDALLYEPSVYDTEAETLAKENHAIWLINSEAVMPHDLPEKIILRYHPCDLPMPPKLKQSVIRRKNGFNRQQVLHLAARLHEQGVKQIGLALSISAYSIQPGFWKRKAAILTKLASEIHQQTGIRIWCLHIGEGTGLPYHPRVTVPDLEEEAVLLQTALLEEYKQDRFPVIMTGVSSQIMEQHGLLITKVLEQRYIYKTFLVMDAGISQYNRPLLKQAYRHVSVLGRNEVENRKLYSLVGSLPDNFDRLVSKGRMLPKVEPGDYCVIHDVGCGGRSMPLLYGLRPVAPEFLYEEGTIRQIAPKRTPQEVLDFLTAW